MLSSQLVANLEPQPLLDEARALLGGAADASIESRAEAGDPAGVLVEIAREVSAELLVVGTARRRFRRPHAARIGR